MGLNAAIDAALFSLYGNMFIERICLLLLKSLIDRFSLSNQHDHVQPTDDGLNMFCIIITTS